MPEVHARSYANPRRLPRRNHYQEGPGFLFVATQVDVPVTPRRCGSRRRVVRRRRAALRRWAEGESQATICAELGCSERACSAGGGATRPRG